MQRILFAAALLAGPVALSPALAQQIPAAPPSVVDRVVKESFTKLPEGWAARLVPDETMQICSVTRNQPSAREAEAIMAREARTVKVPEGSVIGNWKEGEKIAQNGRGGQFSDPPGTVSGGNCYACHQMDPREVSYGTLGPSLVNYGADRKFAAEDAKAAYAKVYNAQAVFACSSMPRFGHNGVLGSEQIKDVVAYLFDPASPVNKPLK
ncbi:sulfur oxidation c-type cytochrome SoxX [Xanthobacter dioxanivorans]|uniref:Sulfur oxidation c-type cytochrome SoxX n=1 Tax=Xanthobacter dioxanivorans TaxID=2528964 RepID=A0A974SJ02_9HYPH|nr:sulfur oxidation c-type cytochrome SoxX [Xanthobacter dioxanivorans]QRG06982.1 sulfur oxidation c-type cytochrome SoxX [Xanthobacter dioxanivorans]